MHVRPMTLDDCSIVSGWVEGERPPGSAGALIHNLDLAAELARPIARGWVAQGDARDDLLAYALIWQILDEVELVALATRPDRRRQGAARALLLAALEAVRKDGAVRVLLEVAASNRPALSLYEALGFRVFNRRPGYYAATGDDALEMELSLASTG
jgi:[ribosomal protein S18]-alanine N-acetyltransferase